MCCRPAHAWSDLIAIVLQDESEDSSRSTTLLQERLRGLQTVCLQLDHQQQQKQQPPGSTSSSSPTGSAQQAALLQQLTSTLRALGPAHPAGKLAGAAAGSARLPPAVVGGKVEAASKGLPTDLRLALRQLEGLRREREGLAARLKAADAQVGWAVLAMEAAAVRC